MAGRITSKSDNRIFYLDVLRALACILVVLIHLGGEMSKSDPTSFWVGHIVNSLSRAGVPIFVMISGALMLDEKYEFTRKKWLAHLIKFSIVFSFWSCAYAAFYAKDIIFSPENFSITETLLSVINGNYHLWFIPMIVGLYLLLPVLRLWVKEENKDTIKYFLIVACVLSFLVPLVMQILENFTDFVGQITIFDRIGMDSATYVVYFILGWYLNTFEIKRKKSIYILGAIGIAGTILVTYFLSIYSAKFTNVYGYNTVNVLCHSIAIFVLAKNIFDKKENTNRVFVGVVEQICDKSLGIYVTHIFAMMVAYKLSIKICPPVDLFLNFLITFFVSFAVTTILKKLPLIKRVV